MKRYLLLLVILFCGHATRAQSCSGSSPTWTASDASSTAVQDCLNETLSCGDTIVVPSDTKTWTVQVTMTPPTGCAANQGVTLEGQSTCTPSLGGQIASSCTDNTNITLSYSGGSNLLVQTCSNTAFCRVTGFSFTIGASVGAGSIQVNGTHGQVGYRVDHTHIINSSTSGPIVFNQNAGYGLFDHVGQTDTASSPSIMFNFYGDFASRGYATWNDTTNPGSNQAAYVEDSFFNTTNSSSEGLFDAYAGCKIVIRYSTLNGNELGGWHGTDSGQYRGCVLGEIYNNTITYAGSSNIPLMNTRSGILLFSNNVVTATGSGVWTSIDLQYYRISNQIPQEISTWGAADTGFGGINWQPLSATSTNILSDIVTANASDWTASHAYSEGNIIGPLSNNAGSGTAGGIGGYNFQAEGNCTSSGTEPNPWNQTPGMTQSDGSCTWLNIGGATESSSVFFDSSNPDTMCTSGGTCTRYLDSGSGVYPFRDQPGLVHNQVVYGNYSCNNSGAGLPATVLTTDSATSSVIQSGRDYFNNTCASGYTPYQYPHPLDTPAVTTTAPAPAPMFTELPPPPTDLTVSIQ